MKKCHNCGTELPANAQFCFNCGSKQKTFNEQTIEKKSDDKKENKDYYNEDYDKQAQLLAEMGLLPSDFKVQKRKKKKSTPIGQQRLDLNQNHQNKNHVKTLNSKKDASSKQIITTEKQFENESIVEKNIEEDIVESQNVIIDTSPKSSVQETTENTSVIIEETENKEIIQPELSNERKKILEELDNQFGTPIDDNGNVIIPEEDQIVVIEDSSPIEISEEFVDNTIIPIAKEEISLQNQDKPKFNSQDIKNNRDKILSKLKSRREHKADISEDEDEGTFENIIEENSKSSLLDNSDLMADEVVEREKETASLFEKLFRKSSVKSNDEDETEGRKNKNRRTRKTNASQMYDMEFDRTHIENDKDPDYDGYYETILPEDYGQKEKSSFDKTMILKVLAILGVAIIVIFIMITFVL